MVIAFFIIGFWLGSLTVFCFYLLKRINKLENKKYKDPRFKKMGGLLSD